VELIDEPQQQRDISAYTEILAGLKFDKNLIRRFLREDLMRESVIYQEIRQEVRQEALEDGRLEGESTLVLRQLARRVGQISPEVLEQIQQLPLAQLEELGEALLDFGSMQDLTDWLQAH